MDAVFLEQSAVWSGHFVGLCSLGRFSWGGAAGSLRHELRSEIFAQRARGCYAEALPERLGPNDARRRPIRLDLTFHPLPNNLNMFDIQNPTCALRCLYRTLPRLNAGLIRKHAAGSEHCEPLRILQSSLLDRCMQSTHAVNPTSRILQ